MSEEFLKLEQKRKQLGIERKRAREKRMLPEGWTLESLDDVVTIGSGQVDPKKEPYASMLHIGAEDIESETGRLLQPKKCSQLGLISGKYEFDERAVVYSKIRPNLNKVCFPRFKGVCSADAYPMWTKDEVLLPAYLKYFLLSPAFVKYAVACSMRTGMPKINREDLLASTIRLPPKTEQARIASTLEAWDLASATTEQLLDNSRSQKEALMEQLLGGRRRLHGYATRRCTYRLGELFNERIEVNRCDLPLLSVTRDEGIIPRDEVGRKDTSNEDKSKYLRVCLGDIAYNTMRMWQGVSALSRFEGIVSPAYTVVIPNGLIDAQFAAYLFKYPPVVFLFYRYSQGLVSDTWNLKFHHFSEVKVEIPELSEQIAIAKLLKDADTEIAALEDELDFLREEKRALMADLLTGKRRVRIPGAAAELEAA